MSLDLSPLLIESYQMALDEQWGQIKAHPVSSDGHTSEAANAAYVIYTSGSTGTPKVVVALHQGMTNRVVAQPDVCALDQDDICCQKTALGFVDSIFEIMGPLSVGARLAIATTDVGRDPKRLVRFVEENGISYLLTVPSLADVILDARTERFPVTRLRMWAMSGEELSVSLVNRMRTLCGAVGIANIYGSSEASADASFHVFAAENALLARAPLGRPFRNTQIYVLNDFLQATPRG